MLVESGTSLLSHCPLTEFCVEEATHKVQAKIQMDMERVFWKKLKSLQLWRCSKPWQRKLNNRCILDKDKHPVDVPAAVMVLPSDRGCQCGGSSERQAENLCDGLTETRVACSTKRWGSLQCCNSKRFGHTVFDDKEPCGGGSDDNDHIGNLNSKDFDFSQVGGEAGMENCAYDPCDRSWFNLWDTSRTVQGQPLIPVSASGCWKMHLQQKACWRIHSRSTTNNNPAAPTYPHLLANWSVAPCFVLTKARIVFRSPQCLCSQMFWLVKVWIEVVCRDFQHSKLVVCCCCHWHAVQERKLWWIQCFLWQWFWVHLFCMSHVALNSKEWLIHSKSLELFPRLVLVGRLVGIALLQFGGFLQRHFARWPSTNLVQTSPLIVLKQLVLLVGTSLGSDLFSVFLVDFWFGRPQFSHCQQFC